MNLNILDVLQSTGFILLMIRESIPSLASENLFRFAVKSFNMDSVVIDNFLVFWDDEVF